MYQKYFITISAYITNIRILVRYVVGFSKFYLQNFQVNIQSQVMAQKVFVNLFLSVNFLESDLDQN